MIELISFAGVHWDITGAATRGIVPGGPQQVKSNQSRPMARPAAAGAEPMESGAGAAMRPGAVITASEPTGFLPVVNGDEPISSNMYVTIAMATK